MANLATSLTPSIQTDSTLATAQPYFFMILKQMVTVFGSVGRVTGGDIPFITKQTVCPAPCDPWCDMVWPFSDNFCKKCALAHAHFHFFKRRKTRQPATQNGEDGNFSSSKQDRHNNQPDYRVENIKIRMFMRFKARK